MNGKIYKVAQSITKEEILQNCQFGEIPDYGDVFTYEEFMDMVEKLYIIDYDGSGRLVLYNKDVKFTSTWLHKRSVFFVDKFFVPFDVLHSIFGNDMKFVWFNK